MNSLVKSIFSTSLALTAAFSLCAADLTVSAISTSKVYGESLGLQDLQFIASIDGTNGTQVVTGIDVAFTNALGEIAYPTNAAADAGTYGIRLSNIRGFDSNAFASVTYIPGTLTVTPRTLQITIGNCPKDYGEEYQFDPTGTYGDFTVKGLVNGDGIKSVNLTCEGAKAKADCRKEGYVITATPADVVGKNGTRLGNYDIKIKPGLLKINPIPITITANDVTNFYGEVSNFAGTEFTVDLAELPNGDFVEMVTLTNVLPTTTGVGTYEDAIVPSHVVAGSQFNTNNYKIAFVNGTLTITQAVLTITANSTNRVYGTTLEPFTGKEFTTEPAVLPNGETVDAVTLTSTAAGDPEAPAKVYPANIVLAGIAASTIDPKNYAITFSNGTLTVTKAPLTIVANNASRVYGEKLAFAGREFTTEPAELPNGEAVETVTITSAKAGDATTPVGEYDGEIAPSHAVTGIDTNNYAIAFSNGTLTVTKRPITLKANDASKTYGETTTFTGTEFAITAGSLVDGDSVDSVTLTSDGAAATAPYVAEGSAIVASDAQGTGLSNYEIAYVSGRLAHARRALTIVANDMTTRYGEALEFTGKEFTTIPDVLPNKERIERVALRNLQAITTEVGTYAHAIEPSCAVEGINIENYDITFSSGSLTVTKAPLEIAVNDATWRVGWTRPTNGMADFSARLKAGDTVEAITGAAEPRYTNAVWRTTKPKDADVGEWPDEIWLDVSSLTGVRLSNYQVTVRPGKLTIVSLADGKLSDHRANAETEVDVSAATVYEGLMYRDEALAGTIQVKIAKGNRRMGLAKLTASIMSDTGKKINVKGSFDPTSEHFVATAKNGTVLDLVLGKDGFHGTFGNLAIEGARNRYSSKTIEDKEIVADADGWMGAYSLAYETVAGLNTFSIAIGKKGKVKVTGTLADSKRISVTAKMIIGLDCCCIPVYSPQKQVSFCLWLADGEIAVTGVDGAVMGIAVDLAEMCVLSLSADDVAAHAEDEEKIVLTDYLPEGSEVLSNGKKWIVMPDENGKAAKAGRLVWDKASGSVDITRSKIDGYNVSNLKFVLNRKARSFSGSFKLYFVSKNRLKTATATVKGVVIDGIGYGMAFAKKIGNMRLMLRAKADQE